MIDGEPTWLKLIVSPVTLCGAFSAMPPASGVMPALLLMADMARSARSSTDGSVEGGTRMRASVLGSGEASGNEDASEAPMPASMRGDDIGTGEAPFQVASSLIGAAS